MVLASDLYAAVDIPAFAQSSMDGYAFSFSGWQVHKTLQIKGEIQAGSDAPILFSPEQAVRIFTGAPIPDGADTVVMQEKANRINGQLVIADEHLFAGINVRLAGSEIKAGTLALPAGTTISPASIGFLAGIGIDKLMVFPKPSISIIVYRERTTTPRAAPAIRTGVRIQFGCAYRGATAIRHCYY